MTIASETNRAGPYSCNGATTVFPFGFKIYDESHIRVVLTNASGVEADLALGTDYTVSGVGVGSGGSVTTSTAHDSGNMITLILDVPFTQNTDLENQGAYFAETIERALDLLTQMALQLKEKLGRAVVLPASETDQVVIPAETLNDIAGNAALVAQYKDAAAASAIAAAASAVLAATFDPSAYLSKAGNLSGLASLSAARTNLGLATVAATGAYSALTGKPTLGTAAAKDTGTLAGNVVEVQTGGKLPALDGSSLTNIGVTRATAVTLSGQTSIDFTGIPSTAKRVRITFARVSTSGSSPILVKAGGGSVQNTGYAASMVQSDLGNGGLVYGTSSSSGFPFPVADASDAVSGSVILDNPAGNTWVASISIGNATGRSGGGGGDVTLSGTLDRIRITTANGTDTFDAGSVNIFWE